MDASVLRGARSLDAAPAIAYTDVRALINSQNKGPEGLEQAAEQFESLFIDWVLKSMREANASLAEGSYLSSPEVEMHQEMLDHQMAIHLSNSGGLGLKALIMDQLAGARPTTQVNSEAADDSSERS